MPLSRNIIVTHKRPCSRLVHASLARPSLYVRMPTFSRHENDFIWLKDAEMAYDMKNRRTNPLSVEKSDLQNLNNIQFAIELIIWRVIAFAAVLRSDYSLVFLLVCLLTACCRLAKLK